MNRVLVNLLVFQAGWFACVMGGSVPAVLYTMGALLFHWAFIMRSLREWLVILGIALLGIGWDVLMTDAGVIRFQEPGLLGLPLWFVCLWLLFATTLSHGFRWLHRRLLAAALLAAVIAPANYLVGSRIGDAHIAQPLLHSLVLMALGWGVLFPLGLYWSRRIHVSV